MRRFDSARPAEGEEEQLATPQLLARKTTPSSMAFATNTVLQNLFVNKIFKNTFKNTFTLYHFYY